MQTLNIKPGDAMPPFSLTAQKGDGSTVEVNLGVLRGAPFVLFYYPQADTPGCTLESKRFTELAGEFARLGAVVYGASGDALQAQYDFQCKYALSMPLLSDPEWAYRKLLGMPDGSLEMVSRITYVVDEEGIVRDVIGVPRIDADKHPDAALESLERLAKD
jgi:peroxiredoxin Q/BCP